RVTCPIITPPANTCAYMLQATNAVGASPFSEARATVLRHPGPPTGILITTSSVDLGTGNASQAISWNPPTNNGGLPVSQQRVWQCSSATGSPCTNTAPGWTLVGTPMAATATNTTNLCPANGFCGYEVWAENGLGKGWAHANSSPISPQFLQANPSTAAPGRIDLSWTMNGHYIGTGLGHFVLFECDSTLPCNNGTWTNVAATAAP